MNREALRLISRYLKGETTPEEDQYVRDLLSKNEHDDDVSQLLSQEWERTSEQNEFNVDLGESWNEFKLKTRTSGDGKEKLRKPAPRKRFSKRIAFILATVTIVLLSLSGIYVYRVYDTGRAATEMAYTIKQTGLGEKLNLSLPDGSFIKLNSSTQLRIPDNYNTGTERVVYLDGEAFFEVARDESKPFKVISGSITTEVLGTSFNVNTTTGDDVRVAVVTGKVRVANDNHVIILHPREMTTMGPATEVPAKETVDLDFVAGWRNNLLIFDKVSFEETINKIEQWYGVKFIIEGRPQHTGKYSGRFENKSLQLVLDGLGFSSAFEYKIIDKTVYLKFK